MLDVSTKRYKIVEPPKDTYAFLCDGVKFAASADGSFYIRKQGAVDMEWFKINKLTMINGKAYAVVSIDGERVQFNAARIMMSVVGKDSRGKNYVVEHLDGDLMNVSIDNLKWVKSGVGRPKKKAG